MTQFEKARPLRAHPRAEARAAHRQGLRHSPRAVSELVQKFLFMKQMMGGLGQNLGMLGKIPGMKQVAMAKNMKKMMARAAACPGWAASPGCPAWAASRDARHGRFPGMGGFPGMGMPGMGGERRRA